LVKVYGHPRSGCNFAVNFIASAFYPEIAEQTKVVWTGHWSNRVQVEVNARELWGDHGFYRGQENCIYVTRDVRDMALSMYRTKQFQHKSWHDLDFSAFIRKPLDWYETPSRKSDKGLNIIEHWYEHVEWWLGRKGVLFIYYEDLVKHPDHVVDMVEHFTGHKQIAMPDLSIAGPFPSSIIGIKKWQKGISQLDLDYIQDILSSIDNGPGWEEWYVAHYLRD
jgi:hypothetical protein